jgi:WD40 repeat protein
MENVQFREHPWVSVDSLCYHICTLDQRRIISTNEAHTIRIWDLVTGQQIGNALQGHTNVVRSVAVCGRLSGSCGKTLIVWDIETGKQIGDPWHGHTHRVMSVAVWILQQASKLVIYCKVILSSILYKILAKIIAKCLTKIATEKELIDETQEVGRLGFATYNEARTLHNIIEDTKENNKELL